MRCFARFLPLVVCLLALARSAPAAESDGIYALRERFCVSLDGDRQCARGTEDLMLLDAAVYYRATADDAWTEIGSVRVNGKRFVIDITREGVGRLVAARTGVDVTERLENFAFTYAGVLARGKMRNGRVRATLDIDVGSGVRRVRAGGTFSGRRIGDAAAPPPPDEFEDFGTTSRDAGAGALGGVRRWLGATSLDR